jgi:hypothetical protein
MPAMSIDAVKREVHDFYVEHPVGQGAHDAFCAWWLRRRWSVEPRLATARAPGGSDDWGLDGFHIERRSNGESPILHLIQAKHSTSTQMVRKAVKGFVKTVEPLRLILAGEPLPPPRTNPVIERLLAALQRLRDEDGVSLDQLRLRFEVLHLCPSGSEGLAKIIQGARETFDDARKDSLPGFEVGLRAVFPPDELDPEIVDPPKLPSRLRFAGEMVSDSANVRFFAGFGYLSDLVKLYGESGEMLFSKNVRSYLYKAHEKGPARHMRESLRRACVQQNGRLLDSPERFAMLHNGVAITASHAERNNGDLVLREPHVLNGCQTVKNAAMWIAERQVRGNVDVDAWENIRIPLRVLITRDEELVRDVTVSNNRQNAIKSSAFRANERVQLVLAERFRNQLRIYYERQEAAFQNLKKTNPRFAEEHFENSFEKPLLMEEIAVAIATAGLRPSLSVAAKASDLFEDAVYGTVFADEKLADLRLLVFLRNLLAVLPLVLRDIKASDGAFATIGQGKFAYPCMRVLSRHIVKHRPAMIAEYGERVLASFTKEKGLRRDVRALMRPANTGLQQLLKENWYEADSGKWRSATDADAVERTLRALRLTDVDVFAMWARAAALR